MRPRAEQQSREKIAALGSARQEVGTVRRRKRNSGRQKRYCQREKPATSVGLPHRVYALGLEINANSSKRSEEACDYLSLKFDDRAFKMAVPFNLQGNEVSEGYTLLWPRPRMNGE